LQPLAESEKFPGFQNPLRSENRSAEIAEEALSTGAGGYVVKSDAAGELLPAVKAVLEGKRFVSASLPDHGLNGPHRYTADYPHRGNVVDIHSATERGDHSPPRGGFLYW
jgi:DNA-binding NarL/FixJ family response regulator